MKQRGRILSFLLVLCLVVGLAPATAFSAPAGSSRAAGFKSAIQIMDGNPFDTIEGYNQDIADDKTNSQTGYQYIYYGTWNKNPIKWRVLADDTGSNSLYLLSENVLDQTAFCSDDTSENKNSWPGSAAQQWCKAFSGEVEAKNVTPAFDTRELDAVLPMTDNGVLPDGVDAPDTGTLRGDKVFFPSRNEMTNTQYGFNDRTEITDTKRKATLAGSNSGRTWWLRTADIVPPAATDVVLGTGEISSRNITSKVTAYTRPAFYLDMDQVLYAFPSNYGGTGNGTTEKTLKRVPSEESWTNSADGLTWRLVLKDESLNGEIGDGTDSPGGFWVALTDAEKPFSTDGDSLQIRYDNVKTGNNSYISAMLVDGTGQVLYYSQLAYCRQNGGGTINVPVPAELTDGSYTLKVFNEEYHGQQNTSYAGKSCDFTIQVVDYSAPELQVETERVDETSAKVTITTNEDSTCYYVLKKAGEVEENWLDAADIINDPAAKRLEFIDGERTKTFVVPGLEPDTAYQIYAMAKDVAANGNETLEEVRGVGIDAQAPPRYEISVNPESITFSNLKEKYPMVTERTVTVTNTGNRTYTLDQIQAANYWDISEYKKASPTSTLADGEDDESQDGFITGPRMELNPGEKAEFTVAPKMGLSPNKYSEPIVITTTQNEVNRVQIPVSLTVDGRTNIDGCIISASAGKGGKVSPDWVEVRPGENRSVTVTPNAGYKINTVMIDGVNDSEALQILRDTNVYTFTDIQRDHTLEVTFRLDDGNDPTDPSNPGEPKYTVTVNQSYAGNSGSGSYEQGETVTIQAGNRENCRFDRWVGEDGITFANADSATTSFIMPGKNVTVTAKWRNLDDGSDPDADPNNGGNNGNNGSNGDNNGNNSSNGSNSGNNSSNGGNSGSNGGNSGGGTSSGGTSGTLYDGKGGTYTGDDTPMAMWISVLCTSFGIMGAMIVLGVRRRKLYPEVFEQWIGLTEREFGQKRRK